MVKSTCGHILGLTTNWGAYFWTRLSSTKENYDTCYRIFIQVTIIVGEGVLTIWFQIHLTSLVKNVVLKQQVPNKYSLEALKKNLEVEGLMMVTTMMRMNMHGQSRPFMLGRPCHFYCTYFGVLLFDTMSPTNVTMVLKITKDMLS